MATRAIREILPGVYHWTVIHEKIHIPVHSYYLAGARVLIDPMLPREGIDWFRKESAPKDILLTNRHHYRHSGKFVEAFGTSVRCHRAGLHEFKQGEKVEPFEHGEDFAGGIRALKVGVLCPEETAFRIPLVGAGRSFTPGRLRRGATSGGALALGDALIRDDRGKLGFVPDEYMGKDPKRVKRGLVQAFRNLLRRRFEHLLLAHGVPLVGDGKEALREFVEGFST